MSTLRWTAEQLAAHTAKLHKVARFRGDRTEMLMDGCRVFLVEAKRRGIAV